MSENLEKKENLLNEKSFAIVKMLEGLEYSSIKKILENVMWSVENKCTIQIAS